MNPSLRRLFVEAGLPETIGWSDVLVIQNYAPLPPPTPWAGIGSWDRGFNAVVLSSTGPSHFCKIRPAGNASLLRETRARNCLADVDSALRVLPAVCTSVNGFTMQVSTFLDGGHYGTHLLTEPVDRFLESMRTVLGSLAPLSDAAIGCIGEEQPRRFPLHSVAIETLRYVAPLLGLAQLDFELVADVLGEAEDLPSRPQHCDLWWRNLIVVDSEFWAIDLEDYGRLHVPLYDDLTLLGSSLAARVPSAANGIDALCSHAGEAAECRGLLTERAATEGVPTNALDALLAFHVMQRARIVHKRAGPGHAATHLATAKHVIDRLTRGERGLLVR